MIKVLTAAGINPSRRGHNAPEYILKLHPFSFLTPPTLVTLFRTSRLRGKCKALLVVDLSASVSSGTTWEVDADGMYCSNNVLFFFALCCLGKIPGGAPFSQLHKSGNGSRVDRPELAIYKDELNNKIAAATNSYTGGDGKMKRMLEPSIKLIG